MKGLSTLSSVLFALFLAAACADDDDPAGGNTGGGSSRGGGGNEPACKFPYTDRTALTLKAATSAAGECAADTDAICGANMVQVAGTCGVACNSQSTDLATVAACTKECIQGEVTPKPSDGCTNCYVANVGCSIINCATECAAGPTTPCNACRLEKGCTAAFYTCSGLPAPSSGSGGSGGGGNGTGGSTGTGTGGAPSAGETGSGGAGGSR